MSARYMEISKAAEKSGRAEAGGSPRGREKGWFDVGVGLHFAVLVVVATRTALRAAATESGLKRAAAAAMGNRSGAYYACPAVADGSTATPGRCC